MQTEVSDLTYLLKLLEKSCEAVNLVTSRGIRLCSICISFLKPRSTFLDRIFLCSFIVSLGFFRINATPLFLENSASDAFCLANTYLLNMLQLNV